MTMSNNRGLSQNPLSCWSGPAGLEPATSSTPITPSPLPPTSTNVQRPLQTRGFVISAIPPASSEVRHFPTHWLHFGYTKDLCLIGRKQQDTSNIWLNTRNKTKQNFWTFHMSLSTLRESPLRRARPFVEPRMLSTRARGILSHRPLLTQPLSSPEKFLFLRESVLTFLIHQQFSSTNGVSSFSSCTLLFQKEVMASKLVRGFTDNEREGNLCEGSYRLSSY